MREGFGGGGILIVLWKGVGDIVSEGPNKLKNNVQH